MNHAEDALETRKSFLLSLSFHLVHRFTLWHRSSQSNLVDSEEAARKASSELAKGLGRVSQEPTSRALEGGPIKINDKKERTLYEKKDVSGMIQTRFGGDDFTTMSEKDRNKMAKKKDKDDQSKLAAFRAHQDRAQQAMQSRPTIQRFRGSMGQRDIHLDNFTVSNGGAELISDAHLMMAYGRRYGLVGRNGTGKSTFLRALASHSIPGTPENCQILHVEQEIIGDDTSALDAVLLCDQERFDLLTEEAAIQERVNQGDTTDADRLQEIHKRLVDIDADRAPARAAAILSGLSFDTEMMAKPTKSFSGGWRMRISLARALFIEPDLLLLDEPTNHLDLHAVIWLENYLLSWPKTVLVVSHSRDFLNTVCQEIVHLQNQKLAVYKGNYDSFEAVRDEKLRNQLRAQESAEAKRAHVQNFIDKFRFNAKRASLVQSRIKALERMAEVEVLQSDPDYDFNFPDPEEIDGNMVGFHDVSFRYNEKSKYLYKDLNFGIDQDSRLAIVGPNGIGKSTLLNLISGVLQPTLGHVTRNPRARIAVFSQHHVDSLEMAFTPLQYFTKQFPGVPEETLRAHLGSFGVNADLANQSMYTLSGGQKSRVAFARLTFTKPHLLLLDEPSRSSWGHSICPLST